MKERCNAYHGCFACRLDPWTFGCSGQCPPLTDTWRSAVEETPLSSAFEESVWGKGAKSIRVVEMAIKSAAEATLTVTRKILDARGREIRPATSIEHAEVSIGAVQHTIDMRSDLGVTVNNAERRYPRIRQAPGRSTACESPSRRSAMVRRALKCVSIRPKAAVRSGRPCDASPLTLDSSLATRREMRKLDCRSVKDGKGRLNIDIDRWSIAAERSWPR